MSRCCMSRSIFTTTYRSNNNNIFSYNININTYINNKIYARVYKWKQHEHYQIVNKTYTIHTLHKIYTYIYLSIVQYFATSPLPALDCYLLYRKWQANKSDCTNCTLRSQIRRVLLSYMQGMRRSKLKKPQFLMNTLYLNHLTL